MVIYTTACVCNLPQSTSICGLPRFLVAYWAEPIEAVGTCACLRGMLICYC